MMLQTANMCRHRQSANAVCQSGRRMSQWLVYYQVRQLRPLIRSTSSDAVKMLVQATWHATHFATAYPMDWWAAEWCCTFHVGRSTIWRHHARATPAALTSGSKAGGLQGGRLGLPFFVRHGSGLPGRWLSAVVWSCVLPTIGTDVLRLLTKDVKQNVVRIA